MSDLPKRIEIDEEGPREGFQIEKGPISTERISQITPSSTSSKPMNSVEKCTCTRFECAMTL